MPSGGKITYRWYDSDVKKACRNELRKRMPLVVEALRSAVVKAISTPCPPHSAPYTPPHAETGKLRQSIFGEVSEDGLTGIVGTPLEYGRFLEEGTRKMAPRPYLRATFSRMARYLASLLTRPMGKGPKGKPASGEFREAD